MGLSWQQGPLSTGAIGRSLLPEPMPERLLYVEPLRRRMRVRFGGAWIADSENVLLLFEPGRYRSRRKKWSGISIRSVTCGIYGKELSPKSPLDREQRDGLVSENCRGMVEKIGEGWVYNRLLPAEKAE